MGALLFPDNFPGTDYSLLGGLLVQLSKKPHGIQDGRKRFVVLVVRGLRRDANEVEQALWPKHCNNPVRFLSAGWRNIAEVGRKSGLAVQAQPLTLPGNLHAGVRLLQVLNYLVCRAMQSAAVARIALGLRHSNNQPIRERAVAAPVIQYPAFRSKGNAASIAIGVFLPVIRVLDRVRTSPILRKVAGRWRRR